MNTFTEYLEVWNTWIVLPIAALLAAYFYFKNKNKCVGFFVIGAFIAVLSTWLWNYIPPDPNKMVSGDYYWFTFLTILSVVGIVFMGISVFKCKPNQLLQDGVKKPSG